MMVREGTDLERGQLCFAPSFLSSYVNSDKFNQRDDVVEEVSENAIDRERRRHFSRVIIPLRKSPAIHFPRFICYKLYK